ncbi:MAG TPA: MlaD family protein [Tepidisphaeraceae bacterium]|jgi:ABC-type transporter Mla subunit MlaD|nr:MlaD family protein [Tepidisphaeraceae bacterium]
MTAYKRNVVTGIVVLSALLVLVWMILTFSGRMMGIFKPKATQVVFVSTRGDGLSQGSPILYRGVQVGKVNGVTRADDNITIQIAGEIDNHPPLPANVSGEIKAQSQLGSAAQIELIVIGEPTGQLTAGEQIRIRYAGNSMFPPEFTDIMEQVRKQEMVVHVDQAIVALHTQIDKFGELMTSVQGLVGDKNLQGDLRKAMANIRAVTERANKIGENLEGLTSNANVTLAKVNDDLDHISRQMGSDLDRLGLVFGQFQEIAAKVNAGKGTASALINDPRLYDELALTAKQLNVVAASMARLVDQWEHEGVALKLAK